MEGDQQANPDIKTFGRKSQIKGNVYWVQKIYADATNGRSYAADLKAKRPDRHGMAALKQQWPGGFNAGFWGRYAKALRQIVECIDAATRRTERTIDHARNDRL